MTRAYDEGVNPRRRRLATWSIGALAAASVLAGCAGPEPAPSVPDLPYGAPIEAGPKPAPLDCRGRIGAEVGAAIRIRAELMTPGVATDEASVRAAAADPEADTTVLGIPLTAGELRALKGNGFGPDPASPIAFWVNAGAPERFGGIWIDPPGTSRYVVAVVDGDPATLAIARCVEGPDVRYVWADVSLAEGTALLNRIGSDTDRWRAQGLQINQIDYDETTGVVNVGVSKPTPEALAALQAAYGPLVRLVVAEPGVPL
jgi:hypothetical protein